MWTLSTHPWMLKRKGPVILAVLDGVGIGKGDRGDAVATAVTPTLDQLMNGPLSRSLYAHGKFVGLGSNKDMGNSEVGHNVLGAGVVHQQGSSLVEDAIASRQLFQGKSWQQVLKHCVGTKQSLHHIGLFSDGNVHSHINHLIISIIEASKQGVQKQYVHALLDGRDVPVRSALKYLDRFEEAMREIRLRDCHVEIASGGGRMTTTMDRYGADWKMVERGYNAHVHGIGRKFTSPREAIEVSYKESNLGDQDLPEFVIADDHGHPVGRILEGDAVVCFNFRGDRALEISQAFEQASFAPFHRGKHPNVFYVGMLQYDGDENIPQHYLVHPPCIERTMGEYLVHNQIKQIAIAETQKYGHVTYFWNGNRSGMFDPSYESYIEIASDNVPFHEQPAMKAAQITERLIETLDSTKTDFVRINYANGDMIGHTGDFEATVAAMEVLDTEVAKLCSIVSRLDGVLMVTADHGNADEMIQYEGNSIVYDNEGKPAVRTSHSLNPVPFCVFDPRYNNQYQLSSQSNLSLSSVAATCFMFLGLTPPEEMASSLLITPEQKDS